MAAFRNTVQKEAVMRVLERKKCHLTAEQVLHEVQIENPVISRSTVFRILNQLSERGDILRIRVPNGADCFDFMTKSHYHVKCTKCGNVFDVDMPVIDNLENGITDTHGFKITGHYIMFSGVCPKCQEGEDTNG